MPLRILFAACLLATAGSVAADTLIHAGNLIDGKSKRVSSSVTIRVQGQRIVAIEPGYSEPAAADQVVDLKAHTVLPGLMDMHTHLAYQYSAKAYLEPFQMNAADYALRAAVFAERTLRAGFTTVRDLGDRYSVVAALRDRINKGDLPGPRILTAGKSLATTGGHADPSNGYADVIEGDAGPKEGVVNGVTDIRKAVRQRYKEGADLIKVTATGGVLSVAKSGQNPQFTQEELDAVIAIAADYGFAVAAHAHGTEGMKRAVLAGVASIEHGTYMDAEVMRLMKQKGTYYVPTITAGRWVAEKARIDGFFPAAVRPKAAAIGPQIQATFAEAYSAGVNIVFGTDSGVSPHGENASEFVYMVEAGMPPMAAIQSATSVAAAFLKFADLGTLEANKLADIIAVRGDPLADISHLKSVDFVMKDGQIIVRP